MNIGLDYDDTYTLDPSSWDAVIAFMRQQGHKVYVVTWRDRSEVKDVYLALETKVDGIYATAREAKSRFMFQQGISINVWIDDNPWTIINSQQPFPSH